MAKNSAKGIGSKKPPRVGGAPGNRLRRRRRPSRHESTLAIMDRLLTSRVSITLSGQPKQISAIEAIVLQLMQKAMAGNARAWRALLKYQEFANRHSDKTLQLTFVESGYTEAFGKSSSGNGDG